MSDNVLAAVLRELERAFEPLISAADSSYGREKLLGDLGWDAAIVLTGDLETAIRSIGPIVKTVTDLADGNLDDFGQLLDAVQAIGNLINALDSLGQAVDSGALAAVIQPQVMGELAEDLLALLVATYLVHYHPWIYLGGIAVTLVDPAAPPRAEIVLADGMVVRRAVERRALRFDHIPKLFEDPVAHLKQFHFNGAVDAAGAKYFSDRVLAEVAQVLALHDFDATYARYREKAERFAVWEEKQIYAGLPVWRPEGLAKLYERASQVRPRCTSPGVILNEPLDRVPVKP